MEEQNKQIKIENIGSSISSILLSVLKNHEDYMNVAHLGGVNLAEQEALNRNSRVKRQCSSLPRIIASQLSLIRISLSVVELESIKEWKSKYPTSTQRDLQPFGNEGSDYLSLLEIRKLLRYCDECYREAQWTNNVRDDFIETIQQERENYAVFDKVLTKNFFLMLEELEETFENIYSILLKNGLITDIQTEIKTRSKSNERY